VVEHGRQACIIEGDAGSGKTFVSRQHVEATRERGFAGVWLNIRSATEPELHGQLTEAFSIGPADANNWMPIGDAFRERVFGRRRFVLACDDADLATPEALERLRNLTDRFGAGVTIVLTSRSASLGRLHQRFGEISELRITLEPWTIDDAEGFLLDEIVAAGGDERVYQREAIARIHELAEGRPRVMARLARLSLLAGAGYRLDAIDAATVDSVAESL
jgi:type II secretory pathway predicted ATPase ExeA